MIVGTDGPAVVLSAETCAFLERHAGLTALRVRVRAVNPRLAKELIELRAVAMRYEPASRLPNFREPESVLRKVAHCWGVSG